MAHIMKNRPGASLAEILVGLLIISIGIMVIMVFSRNTMAVSRDTRGSNAAYLAAEDKINELAAQAFPVSSTATEEITKDNIVCQRSWTIDNPGYIKRAIVTVTYKSFKGEVRTVTLAGAIN
jgi:Tfp pilus assembly protein PilV